MKALFSALITIDSKYGKKTAWLPLPVAYDTESTNMICDRFGVEGGYCGESEEVVHAYRSTLGIAPDKETDWRDVECVAKELLRFTPEQLKCLKDAVSAFGLTFYDICYLLLKKSGKPVNELSISINNSENMEGENV